MANTVGELQPARIYDVTEEGKEIGSVTIECMFNTYEYSVSKSN